VKKWYHVAFLALCAAVLLILWAAPPEKTSRLPADADHADRKDYARCPSCHGPESASPMPPDHVNEERLLRADHVKCYMCHKPAKGG
jgi:hypothetical protein